MEVLISQTSTSANNEIIHITPEKEIVSDTILLNDIYLIQQKYQSHGNTPSERSDSRQNYQHDDSNGNIPRDPSDHESDDENFDDEMEVRSYER